MNNTVNMVNMEKEKEIFKESINVFREIRRYTESFGKERMNVDDLYEAMGNIIQDKLQFDVVIYRVIGEELSKLPATFKQVYASPKHLYIPKHITVNSDGDLEKKDAESFEGSWWLVPFGNVQTFRGYVGIHVLISTEEKVPPNSIFVNNGENKELNSWIKDLVSKGYFIDLIVNVIEHFESALTQVLILSKNEELIKELQEQNKALMFSREENKAAVREGREWVSVMSHEIRTPLFAINSLAELLLDRFKDADETSSEITSSLNLIVNSGKHLSELVNNILDFTKLESDQLKLEHIDFEIRTLINDCVAMNVRNDQRLYPHTCIFIDETVPKVVIGDELRVKQIVMNLINNAVKFTPDDGLVHIHVHSEIIYQKEQEVIRLSVDVYDTGVGIKPHEVNKVFKPFSQTDASITRKFGGSGLGLSICKKLCHLMNGDISFDSNDVDGKGTKFHFHILLGINLKDENDKITDLSKEIPHAVTEWRFLIVDDNDMSRLCTKTHLSNFKIDNVVTVNNLPFIEEEKSRGDYDVYLINTRAKSVIDNVELLKKKVHEQQDRVILQNYPYAKKMLDLDVPIMAEIYGPVTERELKIALTTLAERRNLVAKSDKPTSDIEPLNVHILVAEDNQINQSVIKKMLQKFSVTADFADNGQIALDLYKKQKDKYKVILMDIMMPVMDGYTASAEIRKFSRDNKEPYIIALTANVFWEDRLRAMQAGMNAFVTKPVKLRDLHAVLYKALDYRPNTEELR